MDFLRTVDFCLEKGRRRDLWGTLTLPEKIIYPPILMAHGFLGFKDWSFFPWLAEFFAEQGFPAVRFNFSGSGMGPRTDGPFEELDSFQSDTISNQVEDLRFLIAALIQGRLEPDLPAQSQVYLWGHSRGGGVCLLSARGQKAVQGVAAWAPISRVNRYLFEMKQSWRKKGFFLFESSRTGQSLKVDSTFLEDVEKWGKEGDIPVYLHHLQMPVFLIHGADDSSIPVEESESLAAVHPSSQLTILAGANHKFNASHPFTGPPDVLREAAQKTLEFYQSLSR